MAAAKLKNGYGPRVIVAIPVHNESGYIEKCLGALALQEGATPFDVVALLNNCTDATSRIVDGLASRLPYRLHILEYWLDPSVRSAGLARRMAVRHAEMLAGEGGIERQLAEACRGVLHAIAGLPVGVAVEPVAPAAGLFVEARVHEGQERQRRVA